MVRGGLLNDNSLKRLAKANFKDRTIKHLGQGSFRRADLVFTGKKGIAVRKIPKTIEENVSKLDIFKQQAGEHKLWGKVQKDMSNLDIPVAKIVKRKGPIGYYEHVQGKDMYTKYDTIVSNAIGRMKLNNNGRTLRGIQRLKAKATADVIDPQKMEILKMKYPHLRDANLKNVVGGKLVDFDIGENKIPGVMGLMEDAGEGGSYKTIRRWLGGVK